MTKERQCIIVNLSVNSIELVKMDEKKLSYFALEIKKTSLKLTGIR